FWETHKFGNYAVRYWGFYTRGEGEKDRDVIDKLFKLFKSSHKRSAMHQQQLYNRKPWGPIWDPSKLATWTPLHIIAQEGLAIVYNIFTSASSDINNIRVALNESLKDLEFGTPSSRDEANNTPLHVAASEGHKDVVGLLLRAKAEVDSKD